MNNNILIAVDAGKAVANQLQRFKENRKKSI